MVFFRYSLHSNYFAFNNLESSNVGIWPPGNLSDCSSIEHEVSLYSIKNSFENFMYKYYICIVFTIHFLPPTSPVSFPPLFFNF